MLQKALENPIPTPTFLEFLGAWKIALCNEFLTDPHGHLGRKYKAISATIAKTASFPSIDVIFAYVHPITSWSKNLPPDHRSWGLAQPNLTGIARFCQLQFAWDATTIAAKFSKSLYPGIVMQSLLKVRLLFCILRVNPDGRFSLTICLRSWPPTWSRESVVTTTFLVPPSFECCKAKLPHHIVELSSSTRLRWPPVPSIFG